MVQKTHKHRLTRHLFPCMFYLLNTSTELQHPCINHILKQSMKIVTVSSRSIRNRIDWLFIDTPSYKLTFLQTNCGHLSDAPNCGIHSGSTLFAYLKKIGLNADIDQMQIEISASKLWRPCSEAANCGIRSGSTLFAYVQTWLGTSWNFCKQTMETLIRCC